MGNEIGQLREWDEKREQDWDILKYPIHDTFHHFMQELNHLYLTTPALSAKDYENAGFSGWTAIRKSAVSMRLKEQMEKIVSLLSLISRMRIRKAMNFRWKMRKNWK